MKPNTCSLAIALSLACASIMTAHAQVAPPTTKGAAPAKPPMMRAQRRETRFDEIDTNHDGFISRDEYLAAEKKRFAEFDANHDGKIDAKEIASSPPLMERNERAAERMVKMWDANGDGVVTADEFNKNADERFTKMDREGTGKIARRMPPPNAKPMIQPVKTPPAPESGKKN